MCVYISYDYHNKQTLFSLQHEHGFFFWNLVAEYFIIIFVLLFVISLETYGSLPDKLLRHASHSTLPIFIIPVEILL